MTEAAVIDHGAGFRAEANRFIEVAAWADLDASVPCCPGWQVRDLVFHVAWVLDYFHQIVAGRLTDVEQVSALETLQQPDESELLDVLVDRFALLAADLDGLGGDEPVWNWAFTDMRGAWVHRRMHHELTIHRFDLEAAEGVDHLDVAPEVALDGLDELLAVVATRAKRWGGDEPAVLSVVADSGQAWRVALEPGQRPKVAPDDAGAHVELRGPALPLLLAAWGRGPVTGLLVEGDEVLAVQVLKGIGR